MVTDTIKKIANAILDSGEGCQSGLVYVDPVEAAKAAIEVLSTDAEPVAWASSRGNMNNLVSHKRNATFNVPLYAAPPAPAVTVRALEWIEDGKYLRARMGDREYSINVTADGETWAGATRPYAFGKNLTWSSVPNCSMVSLESAKAACQADYKSRIRSALSAQVQDVAIPDGWQLVPKEPTQEMLEAADDKRPLPETFLIDAYRAMLAAAPAAKLEEKP